MRNLDPSTATQLVDLVFDGTAYRGLDEAILITGIGDGTLIDAVIDGVDADPNITAIDNDYSRVTDTRDEFSEFDITIRHDDFLNRESGLSKSSFDRILLDPPIGEWQPDEGLSLSDLAQYRTIDHTMDPDSIELYLPFIERALSLLSDDGRLVALTPPRFMDSDLAAPLRQLLRKTGDTQVERSPVDTPVKDRYILVLDGGTESIPELTSFDQQAEETRLLGAMSATAGDIMMSLDELDTALPDEDVNSAYLTLSRNDYDVTLVTSEWVPRADGYLPRAALSAATTGTVANHMQAIPSEQCVPEDEPLSGVLRTLAEPDTRYCFVGSPDDVQGQITRFDLNERPVYLYLYSKLSDVELEFRHLIREHDLEWRSSLGPNQSPPSTDGLFDRVSRLQFRTLVNTLTGTRIPIEKEFREARVADTTADLNDLVRLRNDIAHFHPIVQTMYDNPSERSDSAPRTASELAACDALITRIQKQISLDPR